MMVTQNISFLNLCITTSFAEANVLVDDTLMEVKIRNLGVTFNVNADSCERYRQGMLSLF